MSKEHDDLVQGEMLRRVIDIQSGRVGSSSTSAPVSVVPAISWLYKVIGFGIIIMWMGGKFVKEFDPLGCLVRIVNPPAVRVDTTAFDKAEKHRDDLRTEIQELERDLHETKCYLADRSESDLRYEKDELKRAKRILDEAKKRDEWFQKNTNNYPGKCSDLKFAESSYAMRLASLQKLEEKIQRYKEEVVTKERERESLYRKYEVAKNDLALENEKLKAEKQAKGVK